MKGRVTNEGPPPPFNPSMTLVSSAPEDLHNFFLTKPKQKP